MSIGKRIERLEGQVGVNKKPVFLFVKYIGQRELTEEEGQRLMEEAVERNPGQRMYVIHHPDKLERKWEKSLEEWKRGNQDNP